MPTMIRRRGRVRRQATGTPVGPPRDPPISAPTACVPMGRGWPGAAEDTRDLAAGAVAADAPVGR